MVTANCKPSIHFPSGNANVDGHAGEKVCIISIWEQAIDKMIKKDRISISIQIFQQRQYLYK